MPPPPAAAPKWTLPAGSWSPHLKFVASSDVGALIARHRDSLPGPPRFLDVGGRHGEFQHLAQGFAYHILEIDTRVQGDNVIFGDICDCPAVPSESFDVCFSNNVFEHLKEPWRAAEECVRITRRGGLMVHLAPFSWRYHPSPVDFFRYTHAGLAYLFERTGKVETLLAGYDISDRRKDHRGGKVEGGLDVPPVDELGGWREHWLTVVVCRKR